MRFKTLSIYSSIFLVSSATLILEISLIRFFSVASWYHFAFMVVSISLFGIGASGSFLSLLPSLLKRDVLQLLFVFLGLFTLSSLLSLLVANQIPFDPVTLAWDSMQIVYIIIYYVVLSVPFFFSGLAKAVLFSRMAERASSLYFSDLIGAGFASLLFILLSSLSVSTLILSASILGAVSSLIIGRIVSSKACCVSSILIAVLVSLAPFASTLIQIRISPYKSLKTAMRYPDGEILSTHWNAISRVDVINSSYVKHAPGLSYEYRSQLPPQLGITIDGDGLTAITHYTGDLKAVNFTDFLPMALVYKLKDEPSTLILCPGGGLSVLTALYNNARSIVAVETNPIIYDVVSEMYDDFSGDIYEGDRISVYVEDVRGFIARCAVKFDVIQLPMADNVAISSGGIYALSESYLYTVEAFEELYDSLSENGVLSITRWLHPPPREEIRIISLALSVLADKGILNPEDHIAVVRSWCTITLLLKKGEFTLIDKVEVREFCKTRKFDLVYIKGMDPSEVNIYNQFPEPYYHNMVTDLLSSDSLTKIYDDYLFDVSPVTDDRPFFFHFFKWDKIIPIYESMGEKWQPFIEGGYLIPVIFVEALMLSMLFILMPVFLSNKIRRVYAKWRILGYFFSLGLAYLFIEMVLIQKFTLFLGHPVYSVSIVLTGLLCWSGVGSLFTRRLKMEGERSIKLIIPILSGLVIIYLFTLPELFQLMMGYALFARVSASLILMAPLCFMMGMPFPIGIKLAKKIGPDILPWVWSINGCASVLGSILPGIIALSFGFQIVFTLGALAYLSVLISILSLTTAAKSSF